DDTSASYYALSFVGGVIYLDLPNVVLWGNAPVSELKKIAYNVKDFSSLHDAVEQELLLDKRKEYLTLSLKFLGPVSDCVEKHEKEILKELKI
ncbi:MAG: hypothetical protein ABIB11_00565, partial [Candidatus Omnitrophota bacterium]